MTDTKAPEMVERDLDRTEIRRLPGGGIEWSRPELAALATAERSKALLEKLKQSPLFASLSQTEG